MVDETVWPWPDRHGYVIPFPRGLQAKARCGGPGICEKCNAEVAFAVGMGDVAGDPLRIRDDADQRPSLPGFRLPVVRSVDFRLPLGSRVDGVRSFLTDEEREALALSGRLASLVRRIVGDGPTADGDWAEIAAAIHVVQRAIGANAAARAYPHEFRALGSTILAAAVVPDPEPEAEPAALTEICPSCGEATMEDDIETLAGGEERRSRVCGRCLWPPFYPSSPEDWRAHPANPLNQRSQPS